MATFDYVAVLAWCLCQDSNVAFGLMMQMIVSLAAAMHQGQTSAEANEQSRQATQVVGIECPAAGDSFSDHRPSA